MKLVFRDRITGNVFDQVEALESEMNDVARHAGKIELSEQVALFHAQWSECLGSAGRRVRE